MSDAELKRFKQATGATISTKETNNEDDGDVNSDADITPAMLMMAKKANENEKDEAKKSKNNSLIDIITASIYDENGNIIPLEKRAEKMKSIIGEGWEDFKSRMEKKLKDDENSDDFKKALEDALNKIDMSGNILVRLINDILDLARIENGKLQPEISKCDLYSFKGMAKTLFEKSMKDAGLKLVIESDVKDRYVYCDSQHMNQICINLL